LEMFWVGKEKGGREESVGSAGMEAWRPTPSVCVCVQPEWRDAHLRPPLPSCSCSCLVTQQLHEALRLVALRETARSAQRRGHTTNVTTNVKRQARSTLHAWHSIHRASCAHQHHDSSAPALQMTKR
jgi:hypothetical protein